MVWGGVRRVTAALVTVATLLAAGCDLDLPGKPKRADRPKPANEVLDFGTLYGQNCAGCHGKDGTSGPAPPLNDPIFLAIAPDAELLRVVTDGRPGTPMPAFAEKHGGPLTDEQVKAVAAGIKPRWGPGHAPKDVPPYSAPDGKEKGDVGRGAKVFARACAVCHGEQGTGTKDVGPIHEYAFLALISDQAVRRYAITGRPDLGMPNFAGTDRRGKDFKPLSSQDVGDLVALLASWRTGK
jgi:mono/diheme cytochrome c family protein